MKWNLLSISLVMAFSQVGMAFPMIDSIVNKAVKNGRSARVLTSKQQGTCANFSGKWVGTCQADGNSSPQEFIIKQDNCERLEISSFDKDSGVRVTRFGMQGGIKQEGDSQASVSYHSLLSLKWNTDQQVLQVEGAVLVASPYLANAQNIKMSGTIMYDGADLLQFMRVEGDGQGVREESCRFKRK